MPQLAGVDLGPYPGKAREEVRMSVTAWAVIAGDTGLVETEPPSVPLWPPKRNGLALGRN